jgi:hypothetical protein
MRKRISGFMEIVETMVHTSITTAPTKLLFIERKFIFLPIIDVHSISIKREAVYLNDIFAMETLNLLVGNHELYGGMTSQP